MWLPSAREKAFESATARASGGVLEWEQGTVSETVRMWAKESEWRSAVGSAPPLDWEDAVFLSEFESEREWGWGWTLRED